MLKLLSLSDPELMDMLREGGAREERALRQLIKTNGEMIKAFVLKNGGSVEDAEEVLYDALTSLLFNVRAGKFEGESTLNTYFFAIAKRRWYKLFEKNLKRQEREVSLDDSLANHHAFEDAPLVAADTSNALNALLEQLNKGCKEVLKKWSEHYNMDEIAKSLGFKNAQIAMNKKSKCFKQLLEFVEDSPALKASLAELYYA